MNEQELAVLVREEPQGGPGDEAVKITVTIGGKVYPAMLPQPSAEYVVVHLPAGVHDSCRDADRIIMVSGGDTTHDHDTYTAPAWCRTCDEHVGTIRVKVSTIFGIEEDARVLNGRCRVY